MARLRVRALKQLSLRAVDEIREPCPHKTYETWADRAAISALSSAAISRN